VDEMLTGGSSGKVPLAQPRKEEKQTETSMPINCYQKQQWKEEREGIGRCDWLKKQTCV
jgi:hypothetical protein